MLSKEELQLLIKDVFVKGYKHHQLVKSKSGLSKKIRDEITKEFKTTITEKTITNYYRTAIENNKEKGIDDNVIDLFIRYSTFKNIEEIKKITNKKREEVCNDFNKIPFLKSFLEDEKEVKNIAQKKKITTTEKPNKNLVYAFLAFCIVAIVIAAFFFTNTSKIPEVKIINNVHQIYPTKETQFFSPINNEPKVWYATHNNNTEFFNTSGLHPITKKTLKPVTKEFVKTYFISKIPVLVENESQNNSVASTEQSLKQTHVKKRAVKETSVVIKNNSEIDFELSKLFKKEYLKFTKPYTCKGNVIYTFRKNEIQKDFFVCELSLSYTVIANKTNKKVAESHIKSRGAGLSKSSAKKNALTKIQFN